MTVIAAGFDSGRPSQRKDAAAPSRRRRDGAGARPVSRRTAGRRRPAAGARRRGSGWRRRAGRRRRRRPCPPAARAAGPPARRRPVAGSPCRRCRRSRPGRRRRPLSNEDFEEELDIPEFLRAEPLRAHSRRPAARPRPPRRPCDPAGSSPTGGAAGPVSLRLVQPRRPRRRRPGRRRGQPRPGGPRARRARGPAGLDEAGARHGRRARRRARRPGRCPATDALVTATPGLVLCVLVADCVPVLLADPVAGVVAAVHAGREGVRRGVVPAALSAMASLGARARHVTALLGPAVCGDCYEVPAAMQDDVAAVAPAAAVRTRRGTAGLDLRAGIAEVLRGAGVAEVVQDPRCTVEDRTFLPSPRRRHRPAGRAGLARLSRGSRAGARLRDRGREPLEENLRAVRARIDAAARAAGREPASVSLLAVSKTWPAERRARAGRPGQRDFGENRAQELSARRPSSPTSRCAGTSSASSSGTRRRRWPGSARSCTPSTGTRSPRALDRAGQDGARPVDVLVQVDLGRSGGGARGPGRRRPGGPAGAGRCWSPGCPGCGCAG